MEIENRHELVLGTHGRSGEQWDIWQAVFGPMGDDGYPKPIWDKRMGQIDKSVAEYWREHADLSYIMKRDWATLGPKLAGKLHFAVGDMDTWYLNNAVHLTESVLTDPKLSPAANATFTLATKRSSWTDSVSWLTRPVTVVSQALTPGSSRASLSVTAIR